MNNEAITCQWFQNRWRLSWNRFQRIYYMARLSPLSQLKSIKVYVEHLRGLQVRTQGRSDMFKNRQAATVICGQAWVPSLWALDQFVSELAGLEPPTRTYLSTRIKWIAGLTHVLYRKNNNNSYKASFLHRALIIATNKQTNRNHLCNKRNCIF